jgi:hypothetical protein
MSIDIGFGSDTTKTTSQPNMADKPDFATARKALVPDLYEIFLKRWQTAVTKAASPENVSQQSDGNMVESVTDGKFPCCSQSTSSIFWGTP